MNRPLLTYRLIRAEYDEIHELARNNGESSDILLLRLDVTDQRLENANSIRTWVYDLTSLGKLVAASVIPWLSLIQKVLTTVPLGSYTPGPD